LAQVALHLDAELEPLLAARRDVSGAKLETPK